MYRSHRVACSLLVFLGAVSASLAAAETQDRKSISPDSGIRVMPERELVDTPVPVVQKGRLDIETRSGDFEVPIAVSRDWTKPQDDVTRAVIVIPGWPRRDLRSGEHAAEVAGAAARTTVIVTPQFLTARDIAAHNLRDNILRWGEDDWKVGKPSQDAAAISSFQVVDEILHRLANRAIFPSLKTIVLAGHSAGGQFVQDYAVLGRGEADLGSAPVHIRYVVANPATYLYLTDERPDSKGDFAPFNAASCRAFNRWNYGLQADIPAYSPRPDSIDELQTRYLRRDIIYLLGTADNAPDGDGQDQSCAAEAQGTTRYSRGQAFDAYVHILDPHTTQRVYEARGIGHSSYRMFSSVCGQAALFDKPGCDSASE
ncbi:alpha/beta hydrolase [Burkholderia seminalis]|uniref:alpha/beta hydrolase n=1 Tax=Burkholderia seminalis TaxID=488731 RepID=UPI00158EC3B0|nr:alpha/beta hydrolase [Burkholderia seminalis]